MVYLAALVIFGLVTAVIWFVAVALYQQLVGGPDLRQHANYAMTGAVSVLLVTLISFGPFPAGYLLSLGVWWVAAKSCLELPWGRAVTLFLLLAALSMVSRLAMLRVLSF
jgi:hypothetical protein